MNRKGGRIRKTEDGEGWRQWEERKGRREIRIYEGRTGRREDRRRKV